MATSPRKADDEPSLNYRDSSGTAQKLGVGTSESDPAKQPKQSVTIVGGSSRPKKPTTPAPATVAPTSQPPSQPEPTAQAPIFTTADAARGVSHSTPQMIPAPSGLGYTVPGLQRSIMNQEQQRTQAELDWNYASSRRQTVPTNSPQPNAYGGDSISEYKSSRIPSLSGITGSVIDRLQSRTDRSSGFKRQALATGAGVISYGAGTVSGFVAAFNPRSYVELGKMATAPFRGEYYPEIGRRLATSPETTLPFMAGEMKGFGRGQAMAIKKSGVQYTDLNIPDSAGGNIRYRGVSVQQGSMRANIVGVKGEISLNPFKLGKSTTATSSRVSVGTPKLDLKTADFSKGVDINTAGDALIVSKNLEGVANPAELTKFREGVSIIDSTKKTTSRFKEPLPESAKSLSPEQVQEVISFTKKQDGYLYGSYPSQAQMPKRLQRDVGDMDVMLNVDGDVASGLASSLSSRLNAVRGFKTRVTGDALIESKVDGSWRHAVDIHSKDSGGLGAQSVIGDRFAGIETSQPKTFISDTPVTRLSAQGIAKGRSIFTVRSVEGEVKFMPAEHRLKDIPDFFDTQEALILSQRFNQKSKLSRLESLRQLYPEELRTNAEGVVKVEILNPEKVASTNVPSPSPLISSKPSSITSPSPLLSPRSYPNLPSSTPSSPSRFISPRSPSPIVPSPSPMPSSTSPSLSPRSPSPSPFPRSPSPSLSPRSPSPSPFPRSPSPSPFPRSPSPSPFPRSSGYYSSQFTTTPPKASPIFKPTKRDKKQSVISSERLVKSKTAYAPSVESQVFGIFGSMPSQRMVQTGLFTRPLVR